MQRWSVIQHEWPPGLKQGIGNLTPKLEKVTRTLGWVRIEKLTQAVGVAQGVRPMSWLVAGECLRGQGRAGTDGNH